MYITSASPKYHVIIGARNPSKGETVLKSVQAKPGLQGTVSLVHIDATDDASIQAAAKTVEQEFGHLDVLVNNAGICPERPERDGRWTDREKLRDIFDTNVSGPTIIATTFLPLLKKSSNPRIINITSGLGSIGTMSNHGEWPAPVQYPGYRMSKAALNMLTAYQWYQLKPEGFKIWTYCPGYVATDLTDNREERVKTGADSSETSAKGLLEIIQGERDADVGGYIGRNGLKHPW